VVQALRNGSLGTPFERVVGVGHSLGSMVLSSEAGEYRDLDALITTGFSHSLNYASAAVRILGRDYLARSDPKYSGIITDPGYLTSMPGTRQYFYNVEDADPSVIAADEQLKSTDTVVEAATLLMYNYLNADRTLNIPVLVIDGQDEPFFCGLQSADCSSSQTLLDFERPWYGPNATVEALVVPNTGHDTMLERSAPVDIRRMIAFSEQFVGHGSGVVGSAAGARPRIPAPPPTALSLLDQVLGAAFTQAILPAMNATSNGMAPVPGLSYSGPTVDPIPDAGLMLSSVGNTEDAFLGTLPQRVLANL
jgi:pimeloyl-ACP methyl ester carboxylesterase